MKKSSLFSIVSSVLLSASLAFSAGKIQNEDIKSLADIESSNLTTTGTVSNGSFCLTSMASITNLYPNIFVYDTTTPANIPPNTTIVGVPGTCGAGEVQISNAGNNDGAGDTLTFGGQPSQLPNDSKIWVSGLGIDLTLDQAIADQSLFNGITTTQRDAILIPLTNQIIYNITDNEFETYNGTSWVPLTAGLPGGSQYSIQTNSGSSSLFGDSYFLYNGNQAIFNLVDSYGGLHVEGRSGGEASFALQPDTVTDGTAGQWIFYTNGSQLNNQNDFAMFNSELGSPSIILQSATGNVGIGTNNPQNQLNINQSANTTPLTVGSYGFALSNTNSGTPPNTQVITLGADTSNGYIQSWQNESLVLNPLGNNVGVGQTTPLFPLDVLGSENVTSNNTNPVFSIVGAATPTVNYLNVTANGGTAGGLFTINTVGQVGINNPTPAFTLDVVGNENVLGTENITSDNSNPILSLSGAASQTVNYLNVTPNGGTVGNIFEINSTGLVGINNPAPAYTLDIIGNENILGTGIITSDNSNPIFSIIGAATPTVDYLDVTSNGGTAGDIFNITSAGNVGVNTLTPGVPLDISGAARVTSTSNSNVVFSVVGNAGPQTVDYLDVTANGGTAGNIFNISSAGFVGINMLSPAVALDVKGSFNLDGSTSGAFTQSAAAVTTPYGIVWPAAQGAPNTIPSNDGSGNISWIPAIGGMNATNTVRSNSTGTFPFSTSQIPVLDSGGINPVTASVTTTGEDVLVGFTSDGTNQSDNSGVIFTDSSGSVSYATIFFYRDGTFIGASSQYLQTNVTVEIHGVPISGYFYIDSPPPGPHTYTAQVQGGTNRADQGIYYSVLYAKPIGNGLGVAFKATGSGSWTTSNPIALSTVLWDTNSAYNVTTGAFTAPSSAFYMVGWNGNATGGLKQVVIYVNGAPQDLIDNGYSYDPDAIGTSGLFQLNAGDVVTWVAQDNFSTNNTIEWAVSMGGVTSTVIVPHPGEILPNYSPAFTSAPAFGWLDISDLDQTNLATEFGSTDTAIVGNNTSQVEVLSGSNTAVSSTGNTGVVISNSGNITDSGASGNTGNNSIGTGSNAGSGTTGSSMVTTGNATGGASGSNTISTGNSASAGSGSVTLSTGSVTTGQTPGSLLLAPGQDGSNNYGTVHFSAHLKSTQSVVPTAVVNANAGTGATCSLTNATDTVGNVDLVTTATSPAAGDQCDITFTQVYAVAPVCVLSPTSPNGALLDVSDGIYFSTSTTVLTINFANADLVGNTYDWSYYCVETQ